MATPVLEPATERTTSDESLMLDYAAGHASAFDTLYDRHRGGIYRYVLRHCHDRAVTDELFQDVWMSVIRSRASYAPAARFSTWLYRIAHNRVVDHWRTQTGTIIEAHDDETLESVPAARTVEPETRAQSSQLRARLDAALRALPPLQRDAFLLHEEAGLTLAEIAEMTDVPVETVKSRLRYASSRLRECLGDLR